MSEKIYQWLGDQLSIALGFNQTDEIINFIKNMSDVKEQESFLKEILDITNKDHVSIISLFMEQVQEKSQETISGIKIYKKSQEQEVYVSGKAPKKKDNEDTSPNTTKSKGKKSKHVSLYSKDGKAKDIILLEGRHKCNCQATKHELINNCLSCGKVICLQEGSGPCLFCGHLVCTNEELEILNRGSRKSEQLIKKLLGSEANIANYMNDKNKSYSDSLSKAEQHKNTLLEYDVTSEKRTKVIDDESDYFSTDSNRWLTKEQRAALKKRENEIRQQRHGSRLDRKITFDFAGRQIIEQDTFDSEYNPAEDETVKKIMGLDINRKEFINEIENLKKSSLNSSDVINPTINIARPIFDESTISSDDKNNKHPKNSNEQTKFRKRMRLQDGELQEMSDQGFCLSMHQPYASLLVCGIKKDEGRTWYSPIRGRIWIHAASKVPSDEEIQYVQDFYKSYYEDENLPFPSSYPTGCLLGCIDLTECLAQEEYRDIYPNGESSSPYVFVCCNPQELLIKLPMSGNHKIYKLDQQIHQASKKAAKKGI